MAIKSVILDWSCCTVMMSHRVPANRSRARLMAATPMTSRPASTILDREGFRNGRNREKVDMIRSDLRGGDYGKPSECGRGGTQAGGVAVATAVRWIRLGSC